VSAAETQEDGLGASGKRWADAASPVLRRMMADAEKDALRWRIATVEKQVVAAASRNDFKAITEGLRKLSLWGVSAMAARDRDGRTPLAIMAGKGNIQAVRELAGWCDPETRDGHGWTALFFAVRGNRLECAQWLEQVSRADGVDKKGQTILHQAAGARSVEMIQWVLSLPGVDANAIDEDGRTALRTLVGADEDCALAMLDRCDATVRSPDGRTLLMEAAAWGDITLFDALLPRSDANEQDREGATALMLAAQGGWASIVRKLIACPGIDLEAKCQAKQTALEWAMRNGNVPKKCILALCAAMPMEASERALARLGIEKFPELFAQMEAAKMRAVIAEQSPHSPEQLFVRARRSARL